MGFLCLDTRSFLKLLRFNWNCGNFCTLLMLTCIYILTKIWHQDRYYNEKYQHVLTIYFSQNYSLKNNLHGLLGTIIEGQSSSRSTWETDCQMRKEKEEDNFTKKNNSYCSLQYFSSMPGLTQTQSPCAILNVHVWECVKIQWLSKIRPLTVCVGTFTHWHAQKCRRLLECTCVTYRPAKMNHRHQKCSCIWP